MRYIVLVRLVLLLIMVGVLESHVHKLMSKKRVKTSSSTIITTRAVNVLL